MPIPQTHCVWHTYIRVVGFQGSFWGSSKLFRPKSHLQTAEQKKLVKQVGSMT